MKSSVVKLFDYLCWDAPAELCRWRIADEEIQARLERLSRDKAYEFEADSVELFDSVSCLGASESPRWNRRLLFYPGRKLCEEALETALLGARRNESVSVETPEGKLTLTVQNIVRRRVVPVGDELVQLLGMEGVGTVEDYFRWYRAQNEPERRSNAKMYIAYQLLKKIAEQSEYCFDEDERREWLDDRMERYYNALLLAGVDPTVPSEGTDFLTEEEAKEKIKAGFEPQFKGAVACAHIVEKACGVSADAFCEEGLPQLAETYHMSAEAFVAANGRQACYDKLLQDKTLELLSAYTEVFLED